MSGDSSGLRAIERELRTQGYSLVREGKHRIWRHPAEGFVVVPKAHGSADPRAVRNLRAEIKRRKTK